MISGAGVRRLRWDGDRQCMVKGKEEVVVRRHLGAHQLNWSPLGRFSSWDCSSAGGWDCGFQRGPEGSSWFWWGSCRRGHHGPAQKTTVPKPLSYSPPWLTMRLVGSIMALQHADCWGTYPLFFHFEFARARTPSSSSFGLYVSWNHLSQRPWARWPLSRLGSLALPGSHHHHTLPPSLSVMLISEKLTKRCVGVWLSSSSAQHHDYLVSMCGLESQM